MPHSIPSESSGLPTPAALKQLKSVPLVNLAQPKDERERTLKQLLDEGHAAMAPLRHPNLQFHTHLPHLLGSAFRLGADTKLMQDAYNEETSGLVKNTDEAFAKDGELSPGNWTNRLNQKPYAVAYVDFFDAEVKAQNGDWRKVLERYLYTGESPLINGMTGGLGHPFIHLAYAYEYQHSGVASESLSMGCTELDPFHQLVDNPPPDNSTYKTNSLLTVMTRVHADSRLDQLFTEPGFANIFVLMEKRMDVLLEHWSAWEVGDPLRALEQICDLSVLLAISSGDSQQGFDFFNIHLMTVAHALRVLWNDFPSHRLVTILREYALWALAIYISQLRRPFSINEITSVELKGRDWQWVVNTALQHRAALDSHFFKVVSAPKVFAETFGEKDDFYLKAEVKFLDEYRGWVGFGQGTDGVDPAEFSKLE